MTDAIDSFVASLDRKQGRAHGIRKLAAAFLHR